MKKFILTLFILSFLALFFPTLSLRGVHPRSNLKIIGIATAAKPLRNDINKFGIHILEPSDLPKAQELVNSSDGDWGWVTIVIRDDDMNHDKWQDFMDECRIRHLIPLVRIATHLEGSNWAKPKTDDAKSWTNFLNDLNWPVTDQYVIIFNEPNHTKEWGGEVNPKEYAEILSEFSEKLKAKNEKFRILNAGLDPAAPNGKTTTNSYDFMKQMNDEIPGIFEKIDGWSSHSYPNHGFLGKPWEDSKHSVKGYVYELSFLKKNLKLSEDLPVFITETGWPKEETQYKLIKTKTGTKKIAIPKTFYDPQTAADYIKYAFENVWLKDDRIVAVTPFVLNYPQDLFDEFSWLDYEGNPYQQYTTVMEIQKQSWTPTQETKIEIKSLTFPPFLLVNSEYKGKITLKNIGQSIWGEYSKVISESESDNNISLSNLTLPDNTKVIPSEEIILDYSVKSSSIAGEFNVSWENLSSHKVRVFPVSLISQTKYTFWQKVISKVEKFFGR